MKYRLVYMIFFMIDVLIEGVELPYEVLKNKFDTPYKVVSVIKSWEEEYIIGRVNNKDLSDYIKLLDLEGKIDFSSFDKTVDLYAIFLFKYLKKNIEVKVLSESSNLSNHLLDLYSLEKRDFISCQNMSDLQIRNMLRHKILITKKKIQSKNIFSKANAQIFQYENNYKLEVNLRKYYMNLPDYNFFYSGILLVTKEGKLLLQRRDNIQNISNPGKISVFGGQRKAYESAISCALRELEEETGLVCNNQSLIFLDEYSTHLKCGQWMSYSYFMLKDINEKNLQIKEGMVELWSPFDVIKNIYLTPIPKRLIKNLINIGYFKRSS